jgi:hypothetical protein
MMKTNVMLMALAALGATAAWPQEKARPIKTVPAMQTIPLPGHVISFQRYGDQVAAYYFGPDLRRPFVFPVVGPSDRSLTRMGHPQDPETHSHHNSVWISHNDVNGVSFWDDRGQGRILHKRIERFVDSFETASVLTQNQWVTDSNQVLLTEYRMTRVQMLPKGELLLIIDLRLEPNGQDVTLGKTPFGLIGVRMAKTIGVSDGGGTIRNSEGGLNEVEIFWKRARWVDYSGPITPKAVEGITLLDHPANPNHPAIFHARNDGWMGAALTQDAPRVIPLGQALQLRYGLYVHAGQPPIQLIEQRWKKFSETKLPDLKQER